MRRVALALLSATLVALVFAVPANAAIKREVLSNAEPTNLVNITPVRIERDVNPGEHATERVTVFNDSSHPVALDANVIDLGPPKDETLLAEPLLTGTAEFGAKDWVTSEVDTTTLLPFEKISFDIVIEPPADAPVGSSYAGVEFLVDNPESKPASGEAPQVGLKISSVLQVLLTVPGPVTRKLTLLDAKTRDAFHIGDTSFVTYGVRYRNDGTVNDHVKGAITVTSLFGNEVEKIDMRERILIRGAKGRDRKVWSDPPSFGIFTAKLTLQGDDGKVITKDLGRVYLLPPWWLIALIVAVLVLPPVYLWWRRRREWLLYMEDEEWDADGDEHEHAAY
jgi:hypothetical protein